MRNAEASPEGIGGDPRFVRATGIPAARDHGRLDALTTIARDAFDVEDRDRHMARPRFIPVRTILSVETIACTEGTS